ncbi:hypothetical protein L1077_23685 [Pseudoalteromonas luteoviolacea]|uniref:hypothetical protein n=1 Tax=Pseudoalteromonas luteoviolacea TaxID=43657 RepID=UPI001F43F89F|nr:hypothetical protein [Pseudoalteromonas luteoviolacea]MCF6442434.1 hypothetical protein [Pseudoalteromonas luteoviolacea]
MKLIDATDKKAPQYITLYFREDDDSHPLNEKTLNVTSNVTSLLGLSNTEKTNISAAKPNQHAVEKCHIFSKTVLVQNRPNKSFGCIRLSALSFNTSL